MAAADVDNNSHKVRCMLKIKNVYEVNKSHNIYFLHYFFPQMYNFTVNFIKHNTLYVQKLTCTFNYFKCHSSSTTTISRDTRKAASVPINSSQTKSKKLTALSTAARQSMRVCSECIASSNSSKFSGMFAKT